MEIVLGHTSSMEFWRAKRSHSQTRALLARRGEPRSFRSDSPDVAKPSAGDLERLERIGLAQHANPAHFIVPNALSRVRTARITCSVFDRRIPSSAFVNVGDGVFVASPELCLLLEARTAALANLVETGYEFCGRYRLPALPDGNMAPDQLPLTSVPKLQSLLSRTQDVNGVGAARKAVPHILQNSESPKESQLSGTPRRLRVSPGNAEPPCAHLGERARTGRGPNMPLRPVLARRETRCRVRQPAAPCRGGRAGEGLGSQNRVGVRGHPRHHRFKRPTAHEVGNGQGRPCDGETAGNEMSLPSARLGTQADQTTISAAWHHATGNAGRKTAPMTIIGRLKRARPTRRRQKAWSRFATKPKRRANRHQNCHGKPFAPTKQASSQLGRRASPTSGRSGPAAPASCGCRAWRRCASSGCAWCSRK